MAGNLLFEGVPQLPDDWWTAPPPGDPGTVWNAWDRRTYYLWGANSGNFRGVPLGKSLGGDGMAGHDGPSRGRAHPHYMGVITMAKDELQRNDDVFKDLALLIADGANVVVPTHRGRWSLGTGIGANVDHWDVIQEYLLTQVYRLGQEADAVAIPVGTYWPDMRPRMNEARHPIAKQDDLLEIAKLLSAQRGP